MATNDVCNSLIATGNAILCFVDARDLQLIERTVHGELRIFGRWIEPHSGPARAVHDEIRLLLAPRDVMQPLRVRVRQV